jgi:hypothetical protein
MMSWRHLVRTISLALLVAWWCAGCNESYTPQPDLTGEPVDESTQPPANLDLSSPAPNPFWSSVSFRIDLADADHVRVWIADSAGLRVRSLVDAHLPAGIHQLSWDGLDDAGVTAPSGVYAVRVTVSGGHVSRWMTRAR